MLNIALNLAFSISFLFTLGRKTATYAVDPAMISGLPAYQQHMFNAFSNYWVPTLIIFLLLKLTPIRTWLKPTNTIHSLIGISNLLLITYIFIRIFSSSIQGGGASFVVTSLSGIVIIPVIILSFIGLMCLFHRSFKNKIQVDDKNKKLNISDHFIIAIFVAVPSVYFVSQYYGFDTPLQKSLSAYKIFQEKCDSAKEYIYKKPNHINGIYKDYNIIPTRYSKIEKGNLLKWNSGWSDTGNLMETGIVNFFEIKNPEQYIKKGEKKYRRYMKEKYLNNIKDRGKKAYNGEDVHELLSEYGIFYNKFKTEYINGFYLDGGEYKIIDLRTKELIAETSYYASTKLRKFCGNAPTGQFSGLLFAIRVFDKSK